MDVTLRPAVQADIEWLVDLRADVLHADLDRLGRFDEHRMRAGFRPEWTRSIIVEGTDAGCITSRPDGATRWIEHLSTYPSPCRGGESAARSCTR